MAWTDAAMVTLTAATVAASTWAVVVARGSRDSASVAVLTAKDANQIARAANCIASESNQVSRDAAAAAAAVPTDVAWDEALAAMAAIQTYNPTDPTEPVRPLLTAIRTRITRLVDRLEWNGFDKWVTSEMQWGVLLISEATATGMRSGPLTVDQTLEVNETFYTWVAAFTLNLRRFRKVGPEVGSLAQLTDIAQARAKEVAARNGLPEPSEHIPGIAPLDAP